MEFTTTATCRPEIIRRTYESFSTNLLNVSLGASTLYLNVDAAPEGNDPQDIIAIAKMYFRNVVANISTTPCFCQAFKWCWERPNDDFFFHLEDDWLLLKPIDIKDLFETFNRFDDKLAVINLRAYLEITDDRICLSPGLVKTIFAQYIVDELDVTTNPEPQTRVTGPANRTGKNKMGYYGLQYPVQSPEIVIQDIGRPWLAKRGLQRPLSDKYVFNTWEPSRQASV
jgi:hypothetical protein